jgi:hypothetical protein
MKMQETGHFTDLDKACDRIFDALFKFFKHFLEMMLVVGDRYRLPSEVVFLNEFGIYPPEITTVLLKKVLRDIEHNIPANRIRNLAISQILKKKGF